MENSAADYGFAASCVPGRRPETVVDLHEPVYRFCSGAAGNTQTGGAAAPLDRNIHRAAALMATNSQLKLVIGRAAGARSSAMNRNS